MVNFDRKLQRLDRILPCNNRLIYRPGRRHNQKTRMIRHRLYDVGRSAKRILLINFLFSPFLL